MSNLEHLSLVQTIEKVDSLIDSGKGDAGRLYHILEFLKNKRPLYHSDQIYLENKLNSLFDVEDAVVEEEGDLISKIKKLIDSGNGDPGRLQHICDMITNNKSLYHSDAEYLESKLFPTVSETYSTSYESPESELLTQTMPHETLSTLTQKTHIQGSMPKGWKSTDNSNELTDISKNIVNEEKKIQQQQNISNEIDSNRLKLTELKSHRKEYEEKVSQERHSLESQIQSERLRIETQTKLSRDIIAQKEELVKVKKERTGIIKNIDSKKSKITKDLSQQKRQLVQAQLEQEEIEKQIQTEQILLSKMTEEQKSRLIGQAKIAHEIKSKQAELEKTKQDCDDIVSQINEEKAKFTESQKLKTLIKSQEEDLIKSKEERLELINTISKEKEIISKKTQEEHDKLKLQTELTKQLKKDEKAFNSLKKKREKIERQIKSKNKKLTEKQQKIKKQIDEKNKKLKSLAKKPPKKTSLKKPTRKTIKKSKK
jgi:hypothetical protein